MQRHYYVIHSLLINSMHLTNDQLNSFVKKRDGVQNVFVKSFLTRSGHIDTSTHIALVFCHCDIMMLGVL